MIEHDKDGILLTRSTSAGVRTRSDQSVTSGRFHVSPKSRRIVRSWSRTGEPGRSRSRRWPPRPGSPASWSTSTTRTGPGLLLAMARHQDRSSRFLRAVAATRDLAPVPGFEALLRA